MLYIVTRGLDQGRGAAFTSVLGIESGALVHVAAATLGLSALLASSAAAYTAVRYLGAAYLVYLDVRRLLQRGSDGEVRLTERGHLDGIYVVIPAAHSVVTKPGGRVYHLTQVLVR